MGAKRQTIVGHVVMLQFHADQNSDEHKKRSPDCAFFHGPQAKPATRTRKVRFSKSSRVPSQCDTAIDINESANVGQDDDANQMSTLGVDASTASIATKAKKNTKSKKTTAKNNRSKASEMPAEDTEILMESASALPTRSTRGKKRTSDQMLEDSVQMVEPPKKRATRARVSTQVASNKALPQTVDITMEDGELLPVKSKKGNKSGRKRASSTVRKTSSRVASTRSTVSHALPPVSIPANDDIDAELAADLERFDSDDDSDNWKVLGNDDSVTSQIHMPRSTRSSSIRAQMAKSSGKINGSVLKDRSADIVIQAPVSEDPISTAIAAVVQDVEVETGRRERQVTVTTVGRQTTVQNNYALELKQFEESLEADDHEQFASALDIKEASGLVSSFADASQATLGPIDSLAQEVQKPATTNNHSQRDSKDSKSAPKREPPTKKPSAKGRNAKKTSVETAFEAHEEINDEDVAAELEALQVEAQLQSSNSGQQAENSAPTIDAASDLIEKRIPQGSRPVRGQFASPEASPQGSDAENQPPSSRPSQTRPPLAGYTPTGTRTIRVPLAPSTPTASPSKGNAGLQTTYAWTPADMDYVLNGTLVADRENVDLKNLLSSEEKRMTLEEWIKWNAKRNEDRLKADCEMMVGKFESEGVRALKALEGIVCSD